MRAIILAAAAVSLAGCANTMEKAQKSCVSRGFVQADAVYADCVDEYVARKEAKDRAMAAMWLMMQANQAQQPVYTPVQPKPPVAFLKRNYVSGRNRICVYDQLGSEMAVTVGSAELCPIRIP